VNIAPQPEPLSKHYTQCGSCGDLKTCAEDICYPCQDKELAEAQAEDDANNPCLTDWERNR